MISASPDMVLFTISNIRDAPCGDRESLDPNNNASLLVEPDGIEPTTSCLQSTRSPN